VYLNTETLFHATLSILKNLFKIQKNSNYLLPKSKLFRATFIIQASLSVRRRSHCESPLLFLFFSAQTSYIPNRFMFCWPRKSSTERHAKREVSYTSVPL